MNDNFENAFDSINKTIEPFAITMEKIKPGIERFFKNLTPLSEKLIEAGWTINMNMMPYHINEISEIIEIDEIDDYFYSFYMDNGQEEFNKLQDLCRGALDYRLVDAYKECIFAYENQKYITCANTLIAILEGMLSFFSDDKNDIRMIKACRKQLEKYKNEQKTINSIVWFINLRFIERLYAPNNFTESEPPFINRHWLLHGRSAFDIKNIDCLRLLNAIGTICSITKKKK